MSNRADRRKKKKQQPKWQKMTKDQQINALFKNGITAKDLERNYERGRLDGINGTYKICFAAACLAMNDLHGFGGLRCQKVLERMQHYIIESLTSAEAVNDVYKRMKLKVDFGDPESWIDWEDD